MSFSLPIVLRCQAVRCNALFALDSVHNHFLRVSFACQKVLGFGLLMIDDGNVAMMALDIALVGGCKSPFESGP